MECSFGSAYKMIENIFFGFQKTLEVSTSSAFQNSLAFLLMIGIKNVFSHFKITSKRATIF